MKKKILNLIFVLALSVSLTACGGSKQEAANGSAADVQNVVKEEKTTEAKEVATEEKTSEVIEVVTEAETEIATEERPSGIHEDGMGYDPSYGEGIGEVIALSDEEKDYVMSQTTSSWLEMTQIEKDDLVALLARLLEETKNYIVEDFDELVAMLDHQMDQYGRNGINEGVYETVIDILGIK